LNVEAGGSVFEAMKAQEEVKGFYTNWVAEVIAKEFSSLKAKGDIPLEELQAEIIAVLKKHEGNMADPHIVTPVKRNSFRESNQQTAKALNKSRSGLRRSFDNLTYDDINNREHAAGLRPSFVNDEGSLRVKSFIADDGRAYSGGDTEAVFRKLCVESVRKITSKKNLTHMAAVDGSAGGHIAFQTMMLLKKKLDHVCLFHAFSKDSEVDDELPEEFRPDALRARYEDELINKLRLATTKFTFFWEEKKGRNIRKVILQLLGSYQGVKNPMRPTRHEPNFFFCGYTGVKGEKVENSILGSVTDIALRCKISRHSLHYLLNLLSKVLSCVCDVFLVHVEYTAVHMPVVICKHLCPAESRFFVIAVDGSEHSRNGFDIALALVNPRDTLHCVTVKTGSEGCKPATEHKADNSMDDKVFQELTHKMKSSPEAIADYYTAEMQSYGPANSEFVTLTCSAKQTVAECLVEYSDSVRADFFAVSPRARPMLTSVTEYIIVSAKANIILCKN